MNKIWGSNLQHGEYGEQYCIIYLKVAKRLDFKYSLYFFLVQLFLPFINTCFFHFHSFTEIKLTYNIV